MDTAHLTVSVVRRVTVVRRLAKNLIVPTRLNDKPLSVGDSAFIAFAVALSAGRSDQLGVLTDPTSIQINVRSPSQVLSTQIWPSGTITRVGVGLFSFEVDATAAGLWRYKILTTDPCKAALAGSFTVVP